MWLSFVPTLMNDWYETKVRTVYGIRNQNAILSEVKQKCAEQVKSIVSIPTKENHSLLKTI